MRMHIAGLGTAVPPHRIAQADAAAIALRSACATADQERPLRTLYRRAGVEMRHSVVLHASEGALEARQSFYTTTEPSTRERMRRFEAEASPLAVVAARAALLDAGIAPGRITHVITVSCSGFQAPGFDVALI